MNQAQIAAIYQPMLSSFPEAPHRHPPTWEWHQLTRYLPEDRRTRILDAGCGNGCYSAALAEQGYRNVIAIDLFDHLETHGAFRYQKNSIDAIDLPDESVGFLFSLSVIYYLPDPLRGLREFHRVLQPGAPLVVTAHTKHSLFTWKRRLWRAFGKARHLEGVRFRSTGSYLRMMDQAGFEVLDVDGFRLPSLPGSVRRWLPRLGGETPEPTGTVPEHSSRWMKQLRSVLGYHFVIAARKRGSRTG